MNIFEQFGIKEVADVVLYAIDLDKYDDEIYIPILYLNALKISSLEQSASQTVARGGTGNPELIAWDFGKEISVSLQDALFTPASQSLMWGGQYGIQKPRIYGVWDPYVYPTDNTGRPIYYERIEMTPTAVAAEKDGWNMYVADYSNNIAKYFHIYPTYFHDIWSVNPAVMPWFYEDLIVESVNAQKVIYNDVEHDGFLVNCSHPDISTQIICFEDDGLLYFYFTYDDWRFNLPLVNTIELYSFVCPCDGEEKYFFFKQAQGHYLYNKDGEGYIDPMVLTDYYCPSENIINESEEIQRSVGKYTISDNQLNNKAAWYNAQLPEMAYIVVDKFGSFSYQAYEFVSRENDEVCYYHDIDICDESLIKCTDENIDAYGYTWEDTSVVMNSLEKTQETYFLDSVDLRYRIRQDNGTREIAIEYHSDNDNNYKPKIDIYRKVSQKYKDSRGFEQKITIEVLVGSFYIIDDWNLTSTTPQEFAYLINNGLNDVNRLEKMDEIIAKNTFAIDTDKNLRSSNYRYDHKYDNTPLTVFINPRTMQPYEANSNSYITKDGQQIVGNLTIIKAGESYYKWTRTISDKYSSLGNQVIVDAHHFPGAFKIVGQTYARSSWDGQDSHYQFEIPLCKLASDTNISLEAVGDPTTFSMNFKVLQKDDGTMVKLTMYDVNKNPETGNSEIVPTNRISTESIIPNWEEAEVERVYGDYRAVLKNTSYELLNPTDETIQFTDSESDAPLDGTAEGEFHNATVEELTNGVVEDYNATINYGSTVSLPAQELKDSAEEYFSLHMDTIVVKETKTYDIEQESHLVDNHGQIVPGSEEWSIYLSNVISTKFLEPNEYIYRNNFVVLNTQEVGE